MSQVSQQKFGFGINKSRLINYDKGDRRVRQYITDREPTFKLCFSCGACTAGCTAGAHATVNMRRVNVYIRRGELEPIREEVTRCMMCGKCLLTCPRGVNTRTVMALAAEAMKKLDRNEL